MKHNQNLNMSSIFSSTFLNAFEGEIETDLLHRSVYATDASVYREMPKAICYPKHNSDVKKLVEFASLNNLPLIPRGGGTSLAGQCVGNGIIIDLSRHFNKILEVNTTEKWVRVEVGVVRDELNHQIKKHGLFFGPNTSTANRCTLGGMFGNNSSGTSSIRYGTTRDKTLAAKMILDGGQEYYFERNVSNKSSAPIKEILEKTCSLKQDQTLEAALTEYFPKKDIHRRNSGYALDSLFCEEPEHKLLDLLSGSEGTLGICTELKLQLDNIPPKYVTLVCPHYNDVVECLESVKTSMEHPLYACEMMDDVILSCTESNPLYAQKRFFVKGKPKALLILELRSSNKQELENMVSRLREDLTNNSKAQHIAIVSGEQTKDVWELRKAGLGLLANLSGNKKAVACIEDTAVSLDDLPAYISDFSKVMKHFGQEAVYYAHAGAGEIHLRPILDLSTKQGRHDFRAISEAVADLVRKYKGSLSGEHGDGRVRAEFLQSVYGDTIYQGFIKIKQIWDPNNIFNPGKIVFAPPMDEAIRDEGSFQTIIKSPSLNASIDLNKIADKCNGSGDCRKGANAIGQMCPSYKASGEEVHTTRARANAFREFHQQHAGQSITLKDADLKKVLQHCVSCKACSTECPSNVDMGLLKMAFEEFYYKKQGFSFKRYFFGHIYQFNKLGSRIGILSNSIIKSRIGKKLLQTALDIHPERSLPGFIKFDLDNWIKSKETEISGRQTQTVGLYIDEFNRYNNPNLFPKAEEVLKAAGFNVKIINLKQSGRALFSKGYIKKGQELAAANLKALDHLIRNNTPIIGLEPSAVSCFWDEYQKLEGLDHVKTAALAAISYTFSSFLALAYEKGSFTSNIFKQDKKNILLHTHCHEKALGKATKTLQALSIPIGFNVQHIDSACCGMAGSYGYEKDNFSMSQKMANVSLLPTINSKSSDWIVASQGISCSHQIKDLTGRQPYHPVELFHDVLKG